MHTNQVDQLPAECTHGTVPPWLPRQEGLALALKHPMQAAHAKCIAAKRKRSKMPRAMQRALVCKESWNQCKEKCMEQCKPATSVTGLHQGSQEEGSHTASSSLPGRCLDTVLAYNNMKIL
eukprot:1159145-Pelagomonas_calceolata.AAC.2